MDEINQSDRHGHLPKVQKEVLARSPDRAITNSARSAYVRTQRPISGQCKVNKIKSCLTLLIDANQCLSRAQLK
jgi:hypothetical protein